MVLVYDIHICCKDTEHKARLHHLMKEIEIQRANQIYKQNSEKDQITICFIFLVYLVMHIKQTF